MLSAELKGMKAQIRSSLPNLDQISHEANAEGWRDRGRSRGGMGSGRKVSEGTGRGDFRTFIHPPNEQQWRKHTAPTV
jgi:hypothetical protein